MQNRAISLSLATIAVIVATMIAPTLLTWAQPKNVDAAIRSPQLEHTAWSTELDSSYPEPGPYPILYVFLPLLFNAKEAQGTATPTPSPTPTLTPTPTPTPLPYP